ncbi:PREDICTED: butyrophilin subfamily 1 member A1-like [Cariama cristata]|nr:PREDICTED: butyrophilin subfamily 1 member A1-like [Cariama cristata]
MANVTLDPETAHPRLILSKDQKSVRWEYVLQESPDSPERFDADPCVLGCEAFTSGRHYWVVDLAEGQYCAVGVSKESLQRKGPISFNPEEGIWAVQQWGFKNRALTSPPTLLNLPRVPRKIRISLDYEWGEVAFFDVDNKIPIFTFPPASFAGERIRPWFWVELGSLSLVRLPLCSSLRGELGAGVERTLFFVNSWRSLRLEEIKNSPSPNLHTNAGPLPLAKEKMWQTPCACPHGSQVPGQCTNISTVEVPTGEVNARAADLHFGEINLDAQETDIKIRGLLGGNPSLPKINV